jgi:hypothetical protein
MKTAITGAGVLLGGEMRIGGFKFTRCAIESAVTDLNAQYGERCYFWRDENNDLCWRGELDLSEPIVITDVITAPDCIISVGLNG